MAKKQDSPTPPSRATGGQTASPRGDGARGPARKFKCSHLYCGEPQVVEAHNPEEAAEIFHALVGLNSSPFPTEVNEI